MHCLALFLAGLLTEEDPVLTAFALDGPLQRVLLVVDLQVEEGQVPWVADGPKQNVLVILN